MGQIMCHQFYLNRYKFYCSLAKYSFSPIKHTVQRERKQDGAVNIRKCNLMIGRMLSVYRFMQQVISQATKNMSNIESTPNFTNEICIVGFLQSVLGHSPKRYDAKVE